MNRINAAASLTETFFAAKFRIRFIKRALAAAAVLTAALIGGKVQAATDTWDGLGSDGNWSTPANWLAGTAPNANDSLVFSGSTNTSTTNDLTSGTAIDGITFASGAGTSFTLAGNQVFLTGQVQDATTGNNSGTSITGITNNSAFTQTVTLPVNLDWGFYTFNTTSAGNLALNGALTANTGGVAYFGNSGGAQVTTSLSTDGAGLVSGLGGAGLWIGTSASSLPPIQGLATVSGGQIAPVTNFQVFSSASVIGASSASTGSNIELTAAATTTYTFTGTSYVNTIVTTSSVVQNIQGNVSGATLDFGSVSGSGGVYLLSTTTNTQSMTLGNATTIITAGTGSAPGELVFGIDGTGENTTNTLSVSGAIDNNTTLGNNEAVSVVKVGYGSMNMKTAGNYTGGTYVDQGLLQLNVGTATGTGPIYIAGGATLYPEANLSNSLFLSPGIGGVSTYGSVKLSQALTLSGPITLQGTGLSGGAGDRLASTAANTWVLSGQITGTGTLDVDGETAGTGTVQLANASANNNWTGGTLIETANNSADTVKVQDLAGAGHQLGGGDVTMAAGGIGGSAKSGGLATLDINGNNETVGALVSSGTVGDGVITSSTNSPTLTIGNNNHSGTYADVITGGLSITKTGTGTQVFSGSNSYTGGTTINNGILSVSSSGNLGSSTNVTFTGASSSAPGVLQYTGGTTTLAQNLTVNTGNAGVVYNSGGGVLTLSGTLSKNGSILGLSGGQFVVSGTITGSSNNSDLVLGSSTYGGAATVGLLNTNSYNGPTDINAGSTLLTGTNSALPTSPASNVTFGSAGDTSVTNTLDLLGSNQTVSSLNVGSTSGSVVNQVISSNGSASTPAVGSGASGTTANLTVNYNGTPADTFSGSIGGANGQTNINLIKTGTGTLVLSGTNTYTGATTVSAGAVDVTGSTASSATTVAGGAALRGSGTVGNITLQANALLAPGDSPTIGTNLSNSSNNVLNGTSLTLAGGTTLQYNLYSATIGTGSSGNPAGGTLIDLVSAFNSDGSVTTSNQITIDLQNTGIGGTSVSNPNVYTLVEFSDVGGANGDTNLTTADFNFANLNAALSIGGGPTLNFVDLGGGVEALQLDVVPEPSTWAMMLGGLAFLTLAIRRRRLAVASNRLG